MTDVEADVLLAWKSVIQLYVTFILTLREYGLHTCSDSMWSVCSLI